MPRLTIDQCIQRVENLPPAPRILPKLLVLLSQPNVDSSRLVELITLDPGLTAGVLRLCNSAWLGNATPAADLQEAITRLGFHQIYQLVAAIGGAQALSPTQQGYSIQAGELWRHSVCAAVAAQIIARAVGENDAVVFTAALLHDIGKIVLAGALEPVYVKLFREIEQAGISLLEAETRLLGVQHAETGARLLELWNFPDNLVAGIRYHHHPADAGEHQRLASLIYLGNLIAALLGNDYGLFPFALRSRAEAIRILSLAPTDLPQFMIETVEQNELIEILLQTSASPKA